MAEQTKAEFKNISGQDQAIVGAGFGGIVKAGETVVLPADFHNANFVKVVRSQTTTGKDNQTKNN